MTKLFNTGGLALVLTLSAAAMTPALLPQTAQAATKAQLNTDSSAALDNLYAQNPTAKMIGAHARAILVFPTIVKAGLGVGGAFGEGELLEADKIKYFNSLQASVGLQAGAQSYGYVVFLMSQKAVNYIHESAGWEIGVGPTVVVVDEGVARNLSTSTLKDDAYAFTFDQKGLMAGVALEGTKISKIKSNTDLR